MRRTLIRIAVLIVTLVSCITVAELGARLKYAPVPRSYVGEYPDRDHRYFVIDPATGWKILPNQRFQYNPATDVQANSQGFRAPFDFRQDETRKVIALVGDSFTFGFSVSHAETFGAILGESIPSSIVYNFAMPGFGLDQMMDSVRAYALSYNPALVVVNFITDDFRRSLEAFRHGEGFNKPTYKISHDRLVRKTPADTPGNLFRFVESRSALVGAANLALRNLSMLYPCSEWWTLNEGILRQIQVDCREANVPVLFVLIPGMRRSSFPTLRRFMARTDANFLDLADGDLLPIPGSYFPRDGHLTPQGHRYVAQAVRNWIAGHIPGIRVTS